MRPRLLDLFCGAGGAAMGYHRAGFDVVGVDIEPQPRYPFDFIQDDALAVLGILQLMGYYDGYAFDGFAAIHASPPCQAFSRITGSRGDPSAHQDLLTPTRELLQATAMPWVIENVPGAPMRADFRLCGCMFGLRTEGHQLIRERWFETSWRGFDLRAPCQHTEPAIGVYGYGGPRGSSGINSGRLRRWREAMGIDWMTAQELRNAIPPAYTEHIGAALMAHLAGVAA